MITLELLRRNLLIYTVFALLVYLIRISYLNPSILNSKFLQLAVDDNDVDRLEVIDLETNYKESQQVKVGNVTHPPLLHNITQYQNDEISHTHGVSRYLPGWLEGMSQKLRQRLWFMAGGQVRPKPSGSKRNIPLSPEELPGSDRIVNQLMFVPHNYKRTKRKNKKKKILLYHNQIWSWSGELGSGWFKKNRCPVDTCTLTISKAEANTADIIVYTDRQFPYRNHRPANQIWMYYMMESPYASAPLQYKDVFNWTATYRADSDIVNPYGKWVSFDKDKLQKDKPDRNYAKGKTKLVAWFVSDCNDKNNRLKYAEELQKFVQVDIYGACGPLKCPRKRKKKCFQMLETTYKFYLAFENSNCVNYITEKLFVNSLKHDVIPIVMGARPEDYATWAPYHSYIHVDEFDSPKHLAEYILKLDKDDDLYNSYFLWKGTGELITRRFFCRVCAMLHADYPVKNYRDINKWWRGPGTCTPGSWREFNNSNTKMIVGYSVK